MSDLNALLAQLQATTAQIEEEDKPKSNEIENPQLNSLLSSLPQQNQQNQQNSDDIQSALASLSNITSIQNSNQLQSEPSNETNNQTQQQANNDLQNALNGLKNLQTQQNTDQQSQSPLSNLLNPQNSQPSQPSALSGLLGQTNQPQPPQPSALSGLLGQTNQPQQPSQPSALSGLLGQTNQQQPSQPSALSGLLGQTNQQQPSQPSALSGLLGQTNQQQPSALSGLLGQNSSQSQQNSLSSLLSSLNNQQTSSGTSQLSTPLTSLVSKPASSSNSGPKTNLALELQPLDLKEKLIPPYKKRADDFQAKKHVTYDKSVPFSTFINKAEPFTVIELPSGSYELGTTINYPLHIKSANGSRATIKGIGTNEIIISASPHLILENIDIVQESTSFGAIVVANGFTQILNCNINSKCYSSLSIQGSPSSGMPNAVVEVDGCNFTANDKSCITLQRDSTLYMTNTTLENSQMYGVWAQSGSKLYIGAGCLIANNKISGINVQKDCQLRIDGENGKVEIVDNTECGIEIIEKSTAYIDGVKITGTKNLASIYSCFNSFVTIKNSQIVGNESIGLRSESDSSILSVNNTIKDAGINQIVLAHENSAIQCESDIISGKCQAAIVSIEKGYVQCNNVKVESISGVGVVSYNQASIRMIKSSINHIEQIGIQARDGSKLYLEDVTISDSKECGISLTSNPMAYIKRVKISKMNEIGIQIANLNQGFIDIIECESFENCKGGILIQDNVPDGFCTIKDSKFYKNTNLGVNANGCNTRPKFINCSFTNNGIVGVHVLNGAEITLINSIFKGEGKNGIFLNNAIAHIDKAEFSDFQTSAVTCTNSGNADLNDCVIHDNLSFGCYVSDDKSHVKLVKCKLMNHNRSGTLHCSNRGVIRCVDCQIEKDLDHHALIYNGGKVSMKNCDLQNSMKGIGVYVREDGIFKCNKVCIHNEVSRAIDIGKKGVVIAVDSSFSNNVNCGVNIVQYGSGTFTNCTFDKNGQSGIQMRGGNLTLNNCTVSNHENNGICLTKSSNFVDNGTKFANNGQNNISYIE